MRWVVIAFGTGCRYVVEHGVEEGFEVVSVLVPYPADSWAEGFIIGILEEFWGCEWDCSGSPGEG